MQWTDIYDIALALEDEHPEVEIMSVKFTDLWQWVQRLPDFEGDPGQANEKILEAIQAAWLDERD